MFTGNLSLSSSFSSLLGLDKRSTKKPLGMMAVTLTHSLRDYYHSSEVLLRIGAPFKRISLEVNAFAESQSSIKHQMSASYVLAMEIQSLFGVQSYNKSRGSQSIKIDIGKSIDKSISID